METLGEGKAMGWMGKGEGGDFQIGGVGGWVVGYG